MITSSIVQFKSASGLSAPTLQMYVCCLAHCRGGMVLVCKYHCNSRFKDGLLYTSFQFSTELSDVQMALLLASRGLQIFLILYSHLSAPLLAVWKHPLVLNFNSISGINSFQHTVSINTQLKTAYRLKIKTTWAHMGLNETNIILTQQWNT